MKHFPIALIRALRFSLDSCSILTRTLTLLPLLLLKAVPLRRLPRRCAPRNDANPPGPAGHPPFARGTSSPASLAKGRCRHSGGGIQKSLRAFLNYNHTPRPHSYPHATPILLFNLTVALTLLTLLLFKNRSRNPPAYPHATPILLFNLTVALTLLTLLLLKIVLPQNKRQAFRPAFVLHAYLIDGKHSMPAVREHPLQRQTKLLRPQSEI